MKLDNKEKKAYRWQIKKDKTRLKELRKLDKQNLLTEDETWEFTRLLNENTERIDKLTKKLHVVAFVIYGIDFIILIASLIIIFIR